MPITAASEPVHVAVGIIADRGRFLITRRLPNAHQGGRWEFPGGKVHAGETPLAALRRELHEELGVEVRDARPLMHVQHAYADKQVLLDVWSVTSYAGVAHGREGQEARWSSRAELLTLDFPEADLAIQRRLWLPTLYAISDCTRYGRPEFLRRLGRALTGGLQLLQLREPGLGQDEYIGLAREALALCRRHGAKLLLNADPAWVELCGADGVHLNSQRLMQTLIRPLSQKHFVFASCHDEAQLKCAANIGVDAVALGPVASTPSHPGARALGWERLRQLARTATPAVYAIGGMRVRDMARARTQGAHGLAMITGLWDATDVGAVVASCQAA